MDENMKQFCCIFFYFREGEKMCPWNPMNTLNKSTVFPSQGKHKALQVTEATLLWKKSQMCCILHNILSSFLGRHTVHKFIYLRLKQNLCDSYLTPLVQSLCAVNTDVGSLMKSSSVAASESSRSHLSTRPSVSPVKHYLYVMFAERSTVIMITVILSGIYNTKLHLHLSNDVA